MRIILKNGLIYDGTGNAPYKGEVLIDGGRIACVSEHIHVQGEVCCLDLGGKSIAPGFIDAHSHNDWFAIRNEPLKYFDPFIRQGLTTFVTGNCGLSAVGFDENCADPGLIGGGLFFFNDVTGKYGGVREYFDAINENTPCNIAVLAGHCTARASVCANANRELTDDEMSRMLDILEKALQQGAAGISLGLMYEPGLYARTNELREVAKLCLKYDRPLTVHARACSAVSMSYPQLLGRSHLLRAADELVEIVGDTKLKLHYSHAIFVGRNSFKDKEEFVSLIEGMRDRGADAMFDIYNELLGVSVITVILPAWYQAMSHQERRKPFNRLKLAVLVKASSLLLGFGFRDIQVAYIGPGFEKYEGKTVHEVAKMENMSDLQAYLMLCEKSNFKGRVNMGPYSTPEIIRDFSHNDHCLYMTDAWVEDQGIQNPAIYDCFPKFLRDAALGNGDTMPKTIRKMTGATADRFGLKDCGYIRSGCHADLVVFDETALKTAVPDRSCSFGIDKVFISGRLVLDGDKMNSESLKDSGRAIPVV